jgi:hypothetical protein
MEGQGGGEDVMICPRCQHQNPLGRSSVYAKSGRPEQARVELATTIELYRVMAMTFWLPRAEVTLAQVE